MHWFHCIFNVNVEPETLKHDCTALEFELSKVWVWSVSLGGGIIVRCLILLWPTLELVQITHCILGGMTKDGWFLLGDFYSSLPLKYESKINLQGKLCKKL